MNQTREKLNSLVLSRADFWMIWECHGIPCFHFDFLSRNNGKREQLDEKDFRHCYGISFLKVSLWKYLMTAMLKVLTQQLRHLQTSWRFYGHLST